MNRSAKAADGGITAYIYKALGMSGNVKKRKPVKGTCSSCLSTCENFEKQLMWHCLDKSCLIQSYREMKQLTSLCTICRKEPASPDLVFSRQKLALAKWITGDLNQTAPACSNGLLIVFGGANVFAQTDSRLAARPNSSTWTPSQRLALR